MAEEYSNSVKKIVIISDGTGKTAKRLMDAVLSQYSKEYVKFSLLKIYKQVRDKKTIEEILADIDPDYLIIFSIISTDLNDYLERSLNERGILHLNILEPMLSVMTKFLGFHPEYKPGLLHKIDDMYYSKVDAIGYTVEHDDGRGHFIGEADVVLLGLSRTCKTPISVYMACNLGMKVANIPVIAGSHFRNHLLERLSGVDRKRIFGLVMKAEVLARIRKERARVLGGIDTSPDFLEDFSDIGIINQELRFCKRLFSELGVEVVDVTKRAIEEVSLEIEGRVRELE